ncbi:Ger(x)C family spore germination protein [Thermicanus aegyptius]|uniref:Ger(x)C family spore germination protein n=1 Tax=Thermicanus aegyptius TaxID=94009 RepID=UPI00040B79BB|nr:Ger(x)C family spore germination protein [Thermicanus aegyptius]
MGHLLRIHLSLFLFLPLLFLSSCAFRDIDKRGFVVGMGIDPGKEKKYLITLKVAIPNPDIKSGESDFQIYSEENDFIGEAVKRLGAKVEKQLDFNHTKMILFGEKLIKREEVSSLIDWFLRRQEIQRVALVGVGRPDAYSILKIKPKSEHIPFNFLFLAFEESGSNSPYIITTHLFDLSRRLFERGLDPVLPIIRKNKNKGAIINQVVLLDKKKAVTELTPEETEILNLLMYQKRQTGFIVEKGNKKFFLNIGPNHAKIKRWAGDKNGTQTATIQVQLEGELNEMKAKSTQKDLPVYESMATQTLKKKVERLIKKIQKNNVDPLGLGLLYRSHHLGEQGWEKWKSSYPRMKIDVDVKVKIFSTGGINQ